jgi:hypothetical protein
MASTTDPHFVDGEPSIGREPGDKEIKELAIASAHRLKKIMRECTDRVLTLKGRDTQDDGPDGIFLQMTLHEWQSDYAVSANQVPYDTDDQIDPSVDALPESARENARNVASNVGPWLREVTKIVTRQIYVITDHLSDYLSDRWEQPEKSYYLVKRAVVDAIAFLPWGLFCVEINPPPWGDKKRTKESLDAKFRQTTTDVVNRLESIMSNFTDQVLLVKEESAERTPAGFMVFRKELLQWQKDYGEQADNAYGDWVDESNGVVRWVPTLELKNYGEGVYSRTETVIIGLKTLVHQQFQVVVDHGVDYLEDIWDQPEKSHNVVGDAVEKAVADLPNVIPGSNDDE